MPELADPIERFQELFARAADNAPFDPVAVTLATATPDGRPSARIVLLRRVDARGFGFFTNFQSQKGRELLANPHAAICAYWPWLDEQARIEGRVTMVDAEYAGRDIPRPPHWGGFRLTPERIEFWRAGTYRLHDRVVYIRDGDGWRIDVLYP